jgi:cyanophycinase
VNYFHAIIDFSFSIKRGCACLEFLFCNHISCSAIRRCIVFLKKVCCCKHTNSSQNCLHTILFISNTCSFAAKNYNVMISRCYSYFTESNPVIGMSLIVSFIYVLLKENMRSNEGHGCPVPKGLLLIVGGKENKGQQPNGDVSQRNAKRLEIMKAFVDLTKKQNPVIEVITSASSVGDESFGDYKRAFEELGVRNVKHIHHSTRKEVLIDALTDRINQADAFFFSGGDQLLLTGLYGGTALLTQLKNRYIESEIVIAGTSAGAMALSTPMIYAGSNEVQQYGSEIKITTGLEFVKDVCIDTHFVDRGRFVRMAQVIMTNPTCIGLGVEEDTAMVVRNGNEGEVIGSGMIIVIDGFHIEETNLQEFADEKPVSVRNLKVHLLVRGDKYVIPQTNPPHL